MRKIQLFKAAKYITLLCLALVLQLSAVNATPAYPKPLSIKQPNGTYVTIQMHGDEFFGYATTTNGMPVVRKDDGFVYYAAYSTSGVTVTDVRVTDMFTKSIPSTVQPMTTEIAQQLRAKSQILKQLQNKSANTSLFTKAYAAAPSKYLTKPLVVIVNFSDIKCTINNVKQHFSNFLNQKGYNTTGSVKDYYSGNSTGAYDPNFAVYGPIELRNVRSHYGANDEKGGIDINAYQVVIEACEALVKQGVNLKDYDQNNDGVLDNLFFVYAGNPESEGAPATAIWPHRNDITSLNKSVGGVRLGLYGCTSEYKGASGTSLAGIGTFTHEFGHVLGLLDFYDVDYEKNGQGIGLDAISLMAGGNYNNSGNTPPYLSAFERQMLGWLELSEPTPGTTVSLEAIGKSNKGYVIESDNEGEFLVLEARDLNYGLDRFVDAGKSKGLLIYHVDVSQNLILGVTASNLWQSNRINAVAKHECMRLIPSSRVISFENMSSTLYPGSQNRTSFTSQTAPAALTWNSGKFAFELTNIAVDKNGLVSFKPVRSSDMRSVTGTVRSGEMVVAGAQIKLTPVAVARTKGAPSLSLVELYGQTKAADVLYTTSSGTGAFTLSGITAGTYTLTIAQYQFAPYTKTLTIEGDDIAIGDVELESLNLTVETAISLANPIFASYLQVAGEGSGASALQGLRMRWTPAMIVNNKLIGKPINAIYWYSALQYVKAQANVYFGNQLMFSTQINVLPGANMTPVLGNLKVPSDKDLIIEYLFSTSGMVVAMDKGPAIAGYGDIIMMNGQWMSLKAMGLNFNLKIGFSTDKANQSLDKPQLELRALGQYHANIIWGTTDASITQWNIQIAGPGLALEEKTNQTAIQLSQFQPDKTYKISVSPILGDLSGQPQTIEFKTLPLTAPYPTIKISDYDELKSVLTIINVREKPQNIEWIIDGSTVANDSFDCVTQFAAPDKVYVITAKITYTDGVVEKLTRKYKLN